MGWELSGYNTWSRSPHVKDLIHIFHKRGGALLSLLKTKCFVPGSQRKQKYDSSELGEELCHVSSSLPLRVHKVCIRVSFSDTFLSTQL